MPFNKNAFLRYRIIDQCLNNKYRKFTRDTLTEIIKSKLDLGKFSKNSLDKDIAFMKDERILNAPIKNDPNDKFYYYTEPFTLQGFTLSDEEESALHMSLSVLDILKDTKYATSYKSLIDRMLIHT